jgi:hypothetical protein
MFPTAFVMPWEETCLEKTRNFMYTQCFKGKILLSTAMNQQSVGTSKWLTLNDNNTQDDGTWFEVLCAMLRSLVTKISCTV